MVAEFKIEVQMYDDVLKYLQSGCKFSMDEFVIFACDDGWFVMA